VDAPDRCHAPDALQQTSKSNSRPVALDENEPTADALVTSHVVTALDEAHWRNRPHVSIDGGQKQMPALSAQP
jgi:hypothetical protein